MVDLRAWVGVYIRGLAMGSADAVPGVSGGTIALAVAIYERLIAAVTAIDPVQVGRIVAGIAPEVTHTLPAAPQRGDSHLPHKRPLTRR